MAYSRMLSTFVTNIKVILDNKITGLPVNIAQDDPKLVTLKRLQSHLEFSEIILFASLYLNDINQNLFTNDEKVLIFAEFFKYSAGFLTSTLALRFLSRDSHTLPFTFLTVTAALGPFILERMANRIDNMTSEEVKQLQLDAKFYIDTFLTSLNFRSVAASSRNLLRYSANWLNSHFIFFARTVAQGYNYNTEPAPPSFRHQN